MISERQLRRADWAKRFEHGKFRVYTADLVPGLTLIHVDGRNWYRVKGKGFTSSAAQAVRWLNEQEAGRWHAPGSVEALRALRNDSS